MMKNSENIVREISNKLIEKDNENLGDNIQLVIFKLGKEEYGVEIHEVERIIKMQEITKVPHAPSFVEGILNLRGRIVVIINLLKRFGTFKEEEHMGTHILISEVEGNLFGIIVDDVEEVKTIDKKDTRKAPGIIASKIHAEYLRGIGILQEGKRLIIMIDLPKILSEKDMLEMAELTSGIEKKAKEDEIKRKEDEENKKHKVTDSEIEEKFRRDFENRKEKIDVVKEKHNIDVNDRENKIPTKKELEEVFGDKSKINKPKITTKPEENKKK